MVWFRDWDQFAAATEALLVASPDRTRISTKYTDAAGLVEVRVTDNVKCLKFRTHVYDDLQRLNALTRDLSLRLAGLDPSALPPVESPVSASSEAPRRLSAGNASRGASDGRKAPKSRGRRR